MRTFPDNKRYEVNYRRSWASTMNVSLDKIARALVHSDPQCSLEYIDISAKHLSKVAELVF